MGTPEFASNILKGLVGAGFNIVGVVSQPDKEVGRKRILQPSKVKETAMELGLPVVTPIKIRNEYEEIRFGVMPTQGFAQNLSQTYIVFCNYGKRTLFHGSNVFL